MKEKTDQFELEYLYLHDYEADWEAYQKLKGEQTPKQTEEPSRGSIVIDIFSKELD